MPRYLNKVIQINTVIKAELYTKSVNKGKHVYSEKNQEPHIPINIIKNVL